MDDCVFVVQGKRKRLKTFSFQGSYERQRFDTLTVHFLTLGSGDEPGDAGETSRSQNGGRQKTSSVGKTGLRNGQRIARPEGSIRGGGTGGSGGGKPPPRNNKSSVQPIVRVAEDDTETETEDEKVPEEKKGRYSSVPPTQRKSLDRELSDRKNSFVRSHSESAVSNSEIPSASIRGTLVRYSKLVESISAIQESRKPYATFKRTSQVPKKDETSTAPKSPKSRTPEIVPPKVLPGAAPKPEEKTSIAPKFRKSTNTIQSSPKKVVVLPTVLGDVKQTGVAAPTKLNVTTTAASLQSTKMTASESVDVHDHWEEVKNPWEFSDTEISSDDEEDNLSAADDLDAQQLDSEWLQTVTHYRKYSTRDRRPSLLKDYSQGFPRAKELPNEPEFLQVMMPLYRLMTACGRFPFKLVDSTDKLTKRLSFDKTSKEFRYFLATSVLLAMCTLYMTYGFADVFLAKPPFSQYNHVVSLEFDKYWLDGWTTILLLYFLTISSLSILVEGQAIVECLNCWMDSLALIRYNATWGLRRRLFVVFGLFFAQLGLVAIDFFADIGYVRGSRGFIGLLLVDYLKQRLRLNLWWYRFSQLFGLLLDIYLTLAAVFILSIIGAHAWSLDNAARRFNLRLGLSIGMLTFEKPEDCPFELRKLVPYRKLFAEFMVISSFPKILGQAFFVIFNASFFFLIYGMVVTLYGLYSTMMLIDPTEGHTTIFFQVSNVKAGTYVPVKLSEPPATRIFKDALQSAGVWIIGMFFLELVRVPGNTIMEGSRYVLRKGFINCKTLFERRFVASMIYTYVPQAHSFVRPGYGIDRNFIAKFAGFTFGLFVTVFQFNPYRLQTSTFLRCDSLLNCHRITISKAAMSNPQSQIIQPDVKTGEKVSGSSAAGTPAGIVLPEISEAFKQPPCNLSLWNGARPFHLDDFTTKCNNMVFPNVYTKSAVTGLYSRVPNCPKKSVLDPGVPDPAEVVYDCFGEPVNVSITDECGNIFLSTPNLSEDELTHLSPVKPDVQLSVLTLEDSNRPGVFCCFVYDFKHNTKSQADQCSLPAGDLHSGNCRRNEEFLDEKERQTLETAFLNQDVALSKTYEKQWVSCLCQGIGEIKPSLDACESLPESKLNTTTKTTTPSTTTTTSITAPPFIYSCEFHKDVIIQQQVCACLNDTLKNCDMYLLSMFFDCKPKKLGADIYERIGVTQITNGQSEMKFLGEPKDISVCRDGAWNSTELPTGSRLYDCFGNLVDPSLLRDDCGNLKMSYPSFSTGEETNSELIVVDIPITLEQPVDPNQKVYVCCWSYVDLAIDKLKELPVGPKIGEGVCGIAGGSIRDSCALRSTSIVNSKYTCSETLGTDVFNTESVNFLYQDKCQVQGDGNKCDNSKVVI